MIRRARLALPFALTALAACAAAPVRDGVTAPVPGGGYAAFAHYGTHPVVDSADSARVRVGLAADRASWVLVRHYLDRGALPPPEAVRVEDCVAAMAPGVAAPATGWRLSATLAPSPLRAGWHVLVITVTAARAPGDDPPLVVTRTPDDTLEAAFVSRGARLWNGDLAAVPSALEGAERLVLVSEGGGFGGPEAQADRLAAIARAHAAGAVVSVVGRVAPGLDDALLDRVAEAGGGVYDLVAPGLERDIVARLSRAGGLEDTIAELTLSPRAVRRWRLVGHESRAVHTPGLWPTGGFVPAGEAVDLIVELELAEAAAGGAAGETLGRVRVTGSGEARELGLQSLGTDERHAAVVVVAAVAEKLRGSYWMKDASWDALAAELAHVGTPAFRAEVGDVITRARALWVADGRIERATTVQRRLP